MIRTGMLVGMLVIGVWSTSASAQTAEERDACIDDYKKFCAGVVPGGGRILDCLAEHKDALSEACKKVIESHGK